MDGFKAFLRPGAQIGIRNHLAVISTVACANVVAEAISRSVEGAVACTHPYGCDQLGADAELTRDVLYKVGIHPNVGGVLLVGLGCEEINIQDLAADIARSQKPVEALVIQEVGGSSQAIAAGIALATKSQHIIKETVPMVDAELKDLVIGLECGGSDFTSGIAANPAVGIASDRLVGVGAKVLFGETTEILGAEHILAKRSKSVADAILEKVHQVEAAAIAMKVDIRGVQPSPGNIAGGLSSIEEKSLGAICKTGNTPIVGALKFGEIPEYSGLWYMDTPGNDLACTCGLVAGGAHMVLFTTGRGTPMGFATAPVVKITANQKVARFMSENVDLDLSAILNDKMSLDEAGEAIINKILAVANGEMVAAEKSGHYEFGFHRIGPTL